MHIPRLIISALRGGGGKTLLSLGLCRAFAAHDKANRAVKPYKKGPDYIDAHWLELAASAPCTNLDPYFLEQESLRALFIHAWQYHSSSTLFPPTLRPKSSSEHPAHTRASVPLPTENAKNTPYDVALIEGNRGLFDGHDIYGSCSTAEVARALQAPVILSLDITKMTRTSAALIQGMAHFEKDVHIAGVVLNQVGSTRHESIVRQAIEHYTPIPVLGAIPRLPNNPLPERHMGLCQDHGQHVEDILDNLGKTILKYCDVARILWLADQAPALPPTKDFWANIQSSTAQEPKKHNHYLAAQGQSALAEKVLHSSKVRIGYIYDAAFWFYYAENLEALTRQGAELIPLSILDPSPWPEDLQGLYIGGGYPEEFAAAISQSAHLAHIKKLSEHNMPIYAECGGFMLLAKALIRDGQQHAMAHIFPVSTEFFPKPQGLGYVQATVCTANAFHPQGKSLRGHEFHYSKCLPTQADQHVFCFRLDKGTGMGKVQNHEEIPKSAHTKQYNGDGLFVRNTFASYTHIFAPACPWWAENFVTLARAWQKN